MVFGDHCIEVKQMKLGSLKGDCIHYIQVNAIYKSIIVNIGQNFGKGSVANVQVDCYKHGCYRQVLTVLG